MKEVKYPFEVKVVKDIVDGKTFSVEAMEQFFHEVLKDLAAKSIRAALDEGISPTVLIIEGSVYLRGIPKK